MEDVRASWEEFLFKGIVPFFNVGVYEILVKEKCKMSNIYIASIPILLLTQQRDQGDHYLLRLTHFTTDIYLINSHLKKKQQKTEKTLQDLRKEVIAVALIMRYVSGEMAPSIKSSYFFPSIMKGLTVQALLKTVLRFDLLCTS